MTCEWKCNRGHCQRWSRAWNKRGNKNRTEKRNDGRSENPKRGGKEGEHSLQPSPPNYITPQKAYVVCLVKSAATPRPPPPPQGLFWNTRFSLHAISWGTGSQCFFHQFYKSFFVSFSRNFLFLGEKGCSFGFHCILGGNIRIHYSITCVIYLYKYIHFYILCSIPN